MFQDVVGSPGTGTDLPAFYRRRGSYLSKGCTLSVSFLAVDSINGPDHTHSPMAVTRCPGTVKPLLDMSKTSVHGLPMPLAQSQEPTSPSAHTGRPHGPAIVRTRPNCPRLEYPVQLILADPQLTQLSEIVVQLLELTYTSMSYTELVRASPS